MQTIRDTAHRTRLLIGALCRSRGPRAYVALKHAV